MKASALGLESKIYVLNKSTGGTDQFTPSFLSNDGKMVGIKNKDYDLKVGVDYNFHEGEGNLFFYFDEKSWLKARLPLQEKRVERLESEHSQALGLLNEIRKKINTIENGI